MTCAYETFRSWRIVDIVVAAVLGVAVGILFVVWNQVGTVGFNVLEAALPGVGGVVVGVWLLGGPLGALIIQRPGAAIFVETLAAAVSLAFGSQWGMGALIGGVLQGAAAELAFAIFRYRLFVRGVAVLSGGLAAVAAVLLEGVVHGNFAKSFTFQVIYCSTSLVSGVLIGGLLSWFMVQNLAATGVLNRFASGRDMMKRI